MDWAKHTTVFAAVVAAVGLALSAWGTVKSAEVANDQLAKSREDDAKNHRAQAERVNVWGDGTSIVTANRSLDPVWAMVNVQGVSGGDRTKVAHVSYGTIPPCTAVAIPEQVVYGAASEQNRTPRSGWILQSLYFVTSDGASWARWNGGALTEMSSVPDDPPGSTWLVDGKQAKKRALSECGTASQ